MANTSPQSNCKSSNRRPTGAARNRAKSTEQQGLRAPATTTKTQHCLELMRRRGGATIADLMAATGWQAHSVRGFLSGTVKKQMNLNVLTTKDGKGARRYRITQNQDPS